MSTHLSNEELEALVRVSRSVNVHLDVDRVLDEIMRMAMQLLEAEAASIILVDPDSGELVFHLAHGDSSADLAEMRIPAGSGVVGWAIDNAEPVVVDDAGNDKRFYKVIDDDAGFVTRSILCVPMSAQDRKLGAVEVINKIGNGRFNDNDVLVCEAIAAQAATAIERARLHERIVSAERLAGIGQAVAGMAHCIKNVLNGLQGGAFMVDVGIQKEDIATLERGWGIVKKNNGFMKELVQDMLTFSKKREPEYKPSDPNEITSSVCDMLAEKASQKGVSIECELNESIGSVMVDPKGMRRVLLNLVSNAVDACEDTEDGVVRVSVDTRDTTIAFRVRDNGCGMSQEDTGRLFEVFYSTKGSKGTGLGLSVSKKIVDEHGGKIQVNAEVGKGTEFVIVLPLSE